MVDMSPAAVTERLCLMGELWERSFELMNAKEADVKEAISAETIFRIGTETLLESDSPATSFATFF